VIRALARKVAVSEDPRLTAMMPSRRPSRVSVTLRSGEKLEAQVFMNRGDFEDPYPIEELKRKYYELANAAWGHERAEELHGSVMSLEKVEDVNEMTRLIAPMA
jgi:2-methylcitrate dehydratase PrpD